jgi:hypothetical protein
MLDRIRQILPNDPLPNDLLLEDDQQVYV